MLRLCIRNILHYLCRHDCYDMPRVSRELWRIMQWMYRIGKLHLQLGFYRAEWRPVRAVRRWDLQERDRFRRLHKLWIWNILLNTSRHVCRDVPRVSR